MNITEISYSYTAVLSDGESHCLAMKAEVPEDSLDEAVQALKTNVQTRMESLEDMRSLENDLRILKSRVKNMGEIYNRCCRDYRRMMRWIQATGGELPAIQAWPEDMEEFPHPATRETKYYSPRLD